MANVISPYMSLIIPGVGTEPGPTYAVDVNNSLTLIDQHNHSAGSGVQIAPSGLNINSDLTIQSNNLIDVRSVRFQPQATPLATASDVGVIYEAGAAGDLYYNDAAGNQIRLTQGGSIVGTAGSIGGLPSGTASASYSSGTFVWQSATSTSANMDAGSYVFRNNTANSFGLTLNPPNAMVADYSLTLPKIPATTSFMTLDASGNMGATIPISLTSADLSPTANIVGTQLSASANILGTQLSPSANIVGTQLTNGTIGYTQMQAANYTFANISNGVYTNVAPILTLSITAHGRPVIATFYFVSSTFGLISSSTGALELRNNGVAVAYMPVNGTQNVTGVFVDTVSNVGGITYELFYNNLGNGSNVTIVGAALIIQETR